MIKIKVSNLAMRAFLADFRNNDSNTYNCNACVEMLSYFLAGEISNYLQSNSRLVITPLGSIECSEIGEEVVIVPILRAGVAMLSGFQRILPNSQVGFVWAHRNEEAHAIIDKFKLPIIKNKTVILLDTMLASGDTINETAKLVALEEPKQIFCASILATHEGIENLSNNINGLFFVDDSDTLDENKYIYPGVGDSGDRLFGPNRR